MPTILVTGANRGLGLEFVRQYAATDARIIATCRKPGEAGALAELAAAGRGRISVARLDVDSDADMAALAADVPPIDILVCNAGVNTPSTAIATVPRDEFDRVMRTNVMGPIRLAGALLDKVRESERKVIGFLSSRMGSMTESRGGSYLYRASKAALNSVVRNLSIDTPEVTMVALHPGWVRTDMGGPSADIDAATSVAGMIRVLDRLTPADTGRFLNYTGDPIAW